ncbi:FMRFamide receptor-like [Liolophura sinensis]|uniref:FMRFamide receptor-like n=1 Tax=Liolophura sinensis TaxID=3198878 RepID=UPI0031587308
MDDSASLKRVEAAKISLTIENWHDVVHIACYYGLPVIICVGFLGGIINFIVVARHLTSSIETYTHGLVLGTVLLLSSGALLDLHKYIGYVQILEIIRGYVISCKDWFWYTTIWLMVIMSLERFLSLTSNRAKALCSPLQAGITVLMVYLVCLVSALPRFWEFQAVQQFDPRSNRTFLLSEKSKSTDTPEYNVMYFWYVTTITIFLPHPLMLVLAILLYVSIRKSLHSKRRLSKKHSTGQVLNRKVSDEICLTRLLIALMLSYLVLTSPDIVLKLLIKVSPYTIEKGSVLFETLTELFNTLFYFNYMLYFPFLLIYSRIYRITCCNTFCCCCCCCDTSA